MSERIGRGEMTVEECIEWCLNAARSFYQDPEAWFDVAPWREVWGMQQRYSDIVDEQAFEHIEAARSAQHDGRMVAMRYHIVQWRICRAAIRAVERERSK